jgi:hypothetical protein
VSLAANVVRDLIVGVNLNYIHDYLGVPGSGHPVDLGILKIFRMNAGPDTRREIRVAVGLDNAVSPHIVLNPIAGSEHTEHLPRTLRIGTSYETSWGSRPVRSVELAGLTLIAQIEYRDVLNSLFWEGLSAGLEVTYLEVLSLRIGAYSFSLDDYDVPDANRDRLSEFTFGIGATLPLDVLTRSAMPFRLQFDLARMRQPSYSQSMTDWDPFTVVNLSVSTTFR